MIAEQEYIIYARPCFVTSAGLADEAAQCFTNGVASNLCAMHAEKRCLYREDEVGLLSSSGAALTVANSCDSLSGESDINRNCTSSQSLVIAALLAVTYEVRQHALNQDAAALTISAASLCALKAFWTEVMAW